MGQHIIGNVSELPPGERQIVEADGRSIGVFNVQGQYYALRNQCPHQGAPLCLGAIKGMALPSKPGEYRWGREGEILRCPWHGWEFDIMNGRSICNPQRVRVRTYEVTMEATEDPSVEAYPVTIENGLAILHV